MKVFYFMHVCFSVVWSGANAVLKSQSLSSALEMASLRSNRSSDPSLMTWMPRCLGMSLFFSIGVYSHWLDVL